MLRDRGRMTGSAGNSRDRAGNNGISWDLVGSNAIARDGPGKHRPSDILRGGRKSPPTFRLPRYPYAIGKWVRCAPNGPLHAPSRLRNPRKPESCCLAEGSRALTLIRTELGRAYSLAGQQRMEQAAEVLPGLRKQWRRILRERAAHFGVIAAKC